MIIAFVSQFHVYLWGQHPFIIVPYPWLWNLRVPSNIVRLKLYSAPQHEADQCTVLFVFSNNEQISPATSTLIPRYLGRWWQNEELKNWICNLFMRLSYLLGLDMMEFQDCYFCELLQCCSALTAWLLLWSSNLSRNLNILSPTFLVDLSLRWQRTTLRAGGWWNWLLCSTAACSCSSLYHPLGNSSSSCPRAVMETVTDFQLDTEITSISISHRMWSCGYSRQKR